MANSIQIRRGTAAELVTLGNLLVGEFGLSTDTKAVHIGDGSANYEFLMKALFAAGTFAYATSDDIPEAKTDAEVMAILSGDAAAAFSMNSQKITSLADGTAASDAVNLGQLDAYAVGLHPLAEADNCAASTTAALPACTYANGTAGVGATLTGDANGALATQDGITLIDTNRLLVKNQAAALQNGVYQVTTIGTAGTDFVLTRIDAMDEDDEIAMTFVFVAGGTTNGDTSWVCTNEPEAVDVGTDDITFGIFNSPGDITAGTGLAKTGNTIAVDGVLEDLDTLGAVASDGQIIVGTGAGAFAYESGSDARTSLGLTIGTNVQAYDAELLALAGLTFADQKIIVGNGAGTVTTADCTTFAQTILDDADQGAVQDTLGVKPGTDVLAEQTIGIADNNLLEVDGTPLNTEVAVFTTTGINGLSKAETMALLSGGATADFAMGTNKITGVKDPTSDQDAATFKWVTDNFASGSAGANTALSNLASVALNLPLLPDAAAADDFGSATLPFKDLWFAGSSGTPATMNYKLTGASTSGTRTITAPDKSGYMLLTTAVNVLDGGTFA